MEGRASNFEKVLADFEAKLKTAEYVAIDTELTGTGIEGEVDTFDECANVRLDRICRVAEAYSLIQIGFTIVSRRESPGHEGRLSCASYNFFAFPFAPPELKSWDNFFMCQASALRFNAKHRVDFNTWIREGVSYMTREDERFLKARGGVPGHDLEKKVGLLRLWKVLCAAHKPFVVHCPVDLFFLLVAFERRPLPRGDPRTLALLIRQCTPRVYDTAHLYHLFPGRFRRLGLAKFFEDAKAIHEKQVSNSSINGVLPVEFELDGETAVRYSKPAEEMTHEAGYDSLMTAQLFAYLRALAPSKVKEAGNRLFLFRSIEFVDLDRAAVEGVIGCSMFDLSRVTLLVAALETTKDGVSNEAPRLISAADVDYKWMDNSHMLVVLRASGGAAVRKAGELAGKVHGVESWMPFEQWRDEQALQDRNSQCRRPHHQINGNGNGNGHFVETSASSDTNGTGNAVTNGVAAHAASSSPGKPVESSSSARSQPESASPSPSPAPAKSDAIVSIGAEGLLIRWTFILRAVGVTGVLALLALLRLRRRLRTR